MSTATQTTVRESLRTDLERAAFDLGVAHYAAHQSFPRDLGSVLGALNLARTTTRRDRVYRAIRRGLDNAHIARVDAEMSK